MITIDSLKLNLDAIYLDLEGFELPAPKGAIRTIQRCHPQIVAEQYTESGVASFLSQFGYRFVGRSEADCLFVADPPYPYYAD